MKGCIVRLGKGFKNEEQPQMRGADREDLVCGRRTTMTHQDSTPSIPMRRQIRPASLNSGGKSEPYFIPYGRSVPTRNISTWISNAGKLFNQRTWPWVGFALLYAAFYVLAPKIPFSNVITIITHIFLTAGVAYSCDALQRDGSLAFSKFFAAFTRKIGPLMIISLSWFGLIFALWFIIALLGGDAINKILADPQPLLSQISSLTLTGSAPGKISLSTATGIAPDKLIYIGILIIVGIPCCAMAIWFAPVLVILHDIPSVKALGMSFSAFLKNILPLITYNIVMVILIIISSIPFLLGLLVTVPISYICSYTAYRDIFLENEN
jgi:Predicted integral membrane protein